MLFRDCRYDNPNDFRGRVPSETTMHLFPQHRRLVRAGSVVALAVLYTLLNVPKPLQVDDAAYFYFARQFAEDPAHPYDFKVFWYSYPQPAIKILAPPVLPAWWSLAYRVAPDSPWVWKLWLFPFSLLFVGALDVLFRRFCPGQAPPLLWMTVLSPTFLPSLNLMLDVPALALSLTSIVLFLKACPRRDQPPPEPADRMYHMFVPPPKAWVFAGAAGLVAGVAMQTKYTGAVAPAVIVLAGLFFRRPTLPIFAGLLATGVFVGSEYWIAVQHGQSHFVANLPGPDPEYWQTKWAFFWLLAPIIGGLTPAVTLIGLRALGFRHLLWIPRAIFVGLFVAVACLDTNAVWSWLGAWRDVSPAQEWMATFGHKTERWLFAPAGFLLAGVLTAVAGRLCFPWRPQRDPAEQPHWPIGLGSAASWFLVCWLLLELVAYVALTPFGAVRRVMGLVVVSTLCVGRLAARTCRTPAARIDLVATASFGVLLGFLFYKVDLDDANAHRAGAQGAAQWIREQDPQATIWYVGHWGFQYYAEHAGMKPVTPGDTVLSEGDWLVVPEARLNQQSLVIDADCTKPCQVVEAPQGLPLRTVQTFYGGYHSIEHHSGPRLSVTVYRVTASHQTRYGP
jgi:hypothetical protein